MATYNPTDLKWGDGYAGSGGGAVTWSFALTQGEIYDFDYRIDDPAFQQDIRAAFGAWEAVADIDFVEVADSLGSDIRLGWMDIDGPYGEAGTAGYSAFTPDLTHTPFGSFVEVDIRFDIGEYWSTDPDYRGNDVNFYTVALHEIGHALGLDHSPGTIMAAEGDDILDLTAADIAGAQYIYGPAGVDHIVGDNGDNVLIGSANADIIEALGGDDRLYGGGGLNDLDGGSGLDTAVYDGFRSDFDLVRDGQAIAVDAFDGSLSDRAVSVERFAFDDGTLAVDIDGNAGEGYRLYQAAFDRTPDTGGVTYWIHVLDGGASLHDVARSFIDSPEFESKYDANPSNTDYVDLLYQNVLDRAPDAGGYAYWTGRMDDGLTRADMLIAFSESPENEANVADAIDGGIWLA